MSKEEQMLDELSKMPPMVIATAYLHDINYTLYGVDVTDKWITAIQNASALEKAYNKGYYEGLKNQAEREEKPETVTEFADRCRECGKMRTGHWIKTKEQDDAEPFILWKCSECGQVIYPGAENDRRECHAFCGRCGARMEDV